jgi:hypothetical protein
MPARELHWIPRFLARYQALHRDAFASLKSDENKPMQRLHRVGETLVILRDCPGPPESDARLDTRPYLTISSRPVVERSAYGSRVRSEPADYRVVWRRGRENVTDIELVDLV